MAFNAAATYGKNTAKVAADTTTFAVLSDIATGVTLPAVTDGSYVILRIFGRIAGDWGLYSRLSGANTIYGSTNAGGDNLDIPGLEWSLPASSQPVIIGADAACELYVEYALRRNVQR